MVMKLCKLMVVMTMLMMSAAMSAQMKRVIAYQSTPRSVTQYVEVYECDFVDVQPQFPGGEVALVEYINRSRRYPAQAYSSNIQGRVLCSFVVNADGSISHVSIIRGVEPSLNQEAVRLISEMPRWEAGKVANRSVPVHYILPIVFRK